MLTNQTALVTGGSRGIGRAIALELAAHGARVMINFRSDLESATETVSMIERSGGQAMAHPADVRVEKDVQTLVHRTEKELGPIDILVCNAGVVRDALVAGMSLEHWQEVLETNLQGLYLCIRETVPHMMSRRAGSIVNVSSIAASRAGRGQSNYAASKGGINSLTRSLAVELAPRKIRVNAVAPGAIVTDMTQRVRDLASDEILKKIPLSRFGDPKHVAKAVRFLASEDASYITGAILPVTGGLGL